jgi:hypothetical protein
VYCEEKVSDQLKMEKQERLNKFVIELAAFIESYYSSAIIEVSTEKINDWVI